MTLTYLALKKQIFKEEGQSFTSISINTFSWFSSESVDVDWTGDKGGPSVHFWLRKLGGPKSRPTLLK